MFVVVVVVVVVILCPSLRHACREWTVSWNVCSPCGEGKAWFKLCELVNEGLACRRCTRGYDIVND